MEEMGFDLLSSFGCYCLFKEGEISWKKRGRRDPRGLGKISRSVRELERHENSLILSCRPVLLFYVKDLS
jgi:hypothetical protein